MKIQFLSMPMESQVTFHSPQNISEALQQKMILLNKYLWDGFKM